MTQNPYTGEQQVSKTTAGAGLGAAMGPRPSQPRLARKPTAVRIKDSPLFASKAVWPVFAHFVENSIELIVIRY